MNEGGILEEVHLWNYDYNIRIQNHIHKQGLTSHCVHDFSTM